MKLVMKSGWLTFGCQPSITQKSVLLQSYKKVLDTDLKRDKGAVVIDDMFKVW